MKDQAVMFDAVTRDCFSARTRVFAKPVQSRVLRLVLAGLAALVLFASCGSGAGDSAGTVGDTQEAENSPVDTTKAGLVFDATPALNFANAYVAYTQEPHEEEEIVAWVKDQPNVAAGLSEYLAKLYSEARAADPELGLGFDPILDAQDFPSKGFEIASVDTIRGRVMLRGVDQPDFTLVAQQVAEGDNWKVSGIGVVNVIESARAPR